MAENEDIRWIQRFSNYKKALTKLSEAIFYIKTEFQKNDVLIEEVETEDILDEILREGLIQRFEYTHELAWNVMKDFLTEIGGVKIIGSKDATKEAFRAELIGNGDIWMGMIFSRNLTSHSYNNETADEIFFKIINEYHSAFLSFRDAMEEKISGKQQKLF